MKKLFLILLLIIPTSSAWDWQTHQNIALTIATNLPRNLSLNYDLLKEGSIAPDKDFKDNVLHHYPPSYSKTLYWLNLTKYYYNKHNYNNASYAFGVATHYISDSFADPHYISKEPPKLHSEYEKLGYYKIKTPCSDYNLDLNSTLYSASKNNQWNSWLKTKDPKIPEQKVEDASKLIYSVALKTFNTTCNKEKTIISYQKHNFLNKKVIIFLILVVIAYSLYFTYKKLYLSKI